MKFRSFKRCTLSLVARKRFLTGLLLSVIFYCTCVDWGWSSHTQTKVLYRVGKNFGTVNKAIPAQHQKNKKTYTEGDVQFSQPIFDYKDKPNLHIRAYKKNPKEPDKITTKYYCPKETSYDLNAPPCWFENICYIDNVWVTFGKEASDFDAYTIKIGKLTHDFKTKNYEKFTDLDNYQNYRFDGIVTYLLFRPMKNVFFSLMQLAGLLATVEHHNERGMQDTKRRYILIKDKRESHPSFDPMFTWQQFLDRNSNLSKRETLAELNGKCLRKIVINDKGELAASVASGVGRPKTLFKKGTQYIIQRFVKYVTKILRYHSIDPRIPNSFNHVNIGRFKFIPKKPWVGPTFRPKPRPITPLLPHDVTTTKPLAVLMKRTGGKRTIRNLKEIEALVRSYGFKTIIVDYSVLSVYEQITLTRSAALFVGVHGAGLANLLWLRQEVSMMIEIFPYNFQKFTYQALAYINNINYDYWSNENVVSPFNVLLFL
eukprot:Awhi_evm1s334